MALAKCVGVKSNLGRKDFFIIFSLHAKKKLGPFRKKFSLCLSKLSKKEGGESSKARKEKFYPCFIHFFSNARNSGFRKKYE